jgi:DNA polymerase (family 10)
MKNPIPLAKAERYANQIAEALQPFCTRLEIAGSIRRQKPWVGDIDIVAEPRDDGHSGSELRARVVDGKEVIQNGPQNIHIRLTNGVEVQVFLARPAARNLFEELPSNWGSLLLLRTGSKEHNIWLAQTAKANLMEWRVYEGLFRGGKLIASDSEEAIFQALHLPFIPPHQRETKTNPLAGHITLPTASRPSVV